MRVSGLSSRDYENMLELVVSVMDCRNADSAWSLVSAELVRSLRGTTCVFSQSHWSVRRTIQFGDVDVLTPWYCGPLPDDAPEAGRMSSHPLARYYAETGDNAALTVSDLLDERTWLSSETFSELRQTSGATRHIGLPLNTAGSLTRGFVIGRGGIDFTTGEREYVRRLQPLLTRADAHLRELRRWRAQDADIQAADEFRLTPRELTVLSLLADGSTAEAIGRRLGISPRTVHRHLDNLYRKLGTSDRLSTVLRANQAGLLRGKLGRPVGEEPAQPPRLS